ncbi:MAG: enhanced serine sensitivity protein SseB [Erysipelotrichaceae bacterium]|nr:enhanced serine sensitivity protein SseB [Erysipelotrichaceae bacterium]
MSKNKPIENSSLIEAINNLKLNPNKISENMFFSELKKAKFIIPVKFNKQPTVDDNNNYVFDKDVSINLILIKDLKDTYYYPAFLDYGSFKTWNKNVELSNIITDYQGYHQFLNSESNKAKGVAIDPFGLNIICSKELIDDLVDGNMNKINIDDKPIISNPKIYPTSMVNALYDYLKENKNVNKVFLKTLVYPDNMKFLIIVDKDCDDSIFINLREIAFPFSKGVELVFININEEMAINAIKERDIPFFER